MTRVLIVGALIDRVEQGLLEGLVDRGFALEIICEERSPNLAPLRGKGIPIAHRSIRSKFDFGMSRYLRNRLAEGSFDIVYALTARALTTVLFATRGTAQRVVAYRGTVGHLSRLDPTSYLGFLNRRIERIICVSKAVERYLIEKGVPAARVVTIYKGHSPAWYEQGAGIDITTFGVPSGTPVIGCTANMRPVKGVDLLIAAFSKVAARTSAQLLLIGEVRNTGLEEQVRALGLTGRVHFTGFRADAPQIVRGCAVFVMPSRAREGLPKAVIEAMSQGVPAIVTAVGGMPELVENGVSGLVIPPNDPEALADALERVLGNQALRTSLSAGARARIAGEFSIEHTIDATARVLSQR